MPFAPLRIHSGYSFLKSGLTIDRIISAVKTHGYYGAALADLNVMHGVPDFIMKMEHAKYPYLIGLETEVDGFNICFYALDEDGYHRLSDIATTLSKNESIKENLLLSHSGILAIVSTSEGAFKATFSPKDVAFARKINELSKLADRFYLGLEVNNEEERTLADAIRDFAVHHHYLCVAFPKILYFQEDDAIVLKIVDAISNDLRIEEKSKSGTQYFRSIQQYESLYEKSEIDLCSEIIERAKFSLHKRRGEILKFPVENSEIALKEKCFSELKKRGWEHENEYLERLNKELHIINEMGYNDYFLIVSDYVGFAKNNGILVGPGRGSAAGSLVSYLLDITTINPIKYGLLFERFLNPARESLPDIDIDFMDTRRDEVIQYLRDKYGKNKVANIVTFSTILARQSIRDIGRVYSYETRNIDLLSERLLNRNLTLRESYRKLPNFKELVDSDKYYLEIISLASKIENLPRQTGLHAAGIVLNERAIEEAMPVTIDFQGNYISQYEMNFLEEQGFLKMDLLGLRNLTTISNCVDLINEHDKDANLDKFSLPYEETQAIELIASTKTMGIFQLESSGMRRAIKVLKPTCFEDIIALVALFRPGPLQYIDNYAKRKNGIEKFTYFSDDLKDILVSTYGIIVYQEQIIQIAQKMAGFTLSEADVFRRSISKKELNVLKGLEEHFLTGAKKNGYSEKVSREVFEMIAQFANYGMNKSHSACYAMIACQMAFLKAKYPLEFYVSILETSTSTNDPKFGEYVSEMKSLNIQIFSPNINESSLSFSVKDKGLLFPLGAIKGVSGPIVQTILLERKKGLFKDFFDFVSRMFPYKITENQISRLIESGAFDRLHPSRATLLANVSVALQYAQVICDEGGILDLSAANLPKPKLIEVQDDPLENLEKEYETIGIMLSNNPLRYKRDLLLTKDTVSIKEVREASKFAKTVGIIKTVKIITTKQGNQMAFVKIFDEDSELELVIFPTTFTKYFSLLKKNKIIICTIKIEKRENEDSFIANELSLLEE
ncbi:MAG: DNA polymerase III subunit alpha [Bacilli bacterium]